MKPLSEEEFKFHKPLPDKPVEGEGGIPTTQLPRQCPTCDKHHFKASECAVTNPIERFELCPTCLKEEQAQARQEYAPNPSLDDLPPLEESDRDEYWK